MDRGLAFPVAPPHEECGRVRLSTFELNGTYLGIFCADLSLESASSGTGSFGFVGQGQAAPKIIEELVRGTIAARGELQNLNKPIGIIWAVHFPPAFPDVPETLSLLQCERLLEAAVGCNVSYILCGHTHKTLMYKASCDKGTVTIICSGPSSGVSRHGKYSFSVMEIDVFHDGSTFVTPTAFSLRDFRFVQEEVFPVS